MRLTNQVARNKNKADREEEAANQKTGDGAAANQWTGDKKKHPVREEKAEQTNQRRE